MHILSFIPNLIDGATGSVLVLIAIIILCAFIQEDLTIIIVGMLAADGFISVPVAFFSLYAGILLGDTMLYALGSLARSHPKLARYIDHDFTAPLRTWLGSTYGLKVFLGHFIPGFRFTTYAASGFFRYPLRTYIPMAVLGGLFLESMYFSASYWFGSLTTEWVGEVRWGVAGIFLLVIFFVGRHNLMAYRKLKDANAAHALVSGMTADIPKR